MMWECSYSREPVNYRLVWLRLIQKLWLLPLGALVGAVLVGGIYYVSRMYVGQGRIYEAKTIYYLDFAEDSAGNTYDYLNHYTWAEVIQMDQIVGRSLELLKGKLTREQYQEYVTATIESDVRYLYTRCTTPQPELSLEIDKALQQAVLEFGQSQKEFQEIRVTKAADEAVDVSNIRTLNAVLLGAGIGVFAAVLGWLLKAIGDTSVYLPVSLENRYHGKCLGAPSMEEFRYNVETLVPPEKKKYLMSGDRSYTLQELPEGMQEYQLVPNVILQPDIASQIKDGVVVVYVKAGAQNGKQVERTLEQLSRQEIVVAATMLVEENPFLIRRYYRK